MKLSPAQVEAIRKGIEEREYADAVRQVVDGGDLDRGKVSRLEFISTGDILLDSEDIDTLLDNGDRAERVREHVDEQVAKLTQEWLATNRGRQWLEDKVNNYLDEELEAIREEATGRQT